MGRGRVLVLVDHAALNPGTQALIDFAETCLDRFEFRFVARHADSLVSTLAVLGKVWRLDQPGDWNAFATSWQPQAILATSTGAISLTRDLPVPYAPGILYVYDDNNTVGHQQPGRQSEFIQWPDLYLAPNSGAAEYLSKHLFIPDGKIIAGAPHLTRRRFEQLLEAVRQPHDKIVVGSIGGADWLSGPALWIYLAKELKQLAGADNILLKRVGRFLGDLDDQRFRREMDLLEIGGYTQLIGEMHHVPEMLANIDVLAVTGWNDLSHYGVLEAMTMGVPVVCFSGNAAVAELVRDSGVLIDSYDPREMARTIYQLAGDADAATCLGARERKKVEQRFLDSNQATLSAALESLVVRA